jgi:hypothetical protein
MLGFMLTTNTKTAEKHTHTREPAHRTHTAAKNEGRAKLRPMSTAQLEQVNGGVTAVEYCLCLGVIAAALIVP